MLSVGLTFESRVAARAGAGLVGPNAVIQLAETLRAEPGAAEQVFGRAGFSRLLRSPPDAMIDETIPARLFEALWREFTPGSATRFAREAGRRTGAYVLANRIPDVARLILRSLPPRLAAPLLLRAIRRNAWTFAGSGDCRVVPGQPALVSITDNPLAMPGGAWHVGVFEQLFDALVCPGPRVTYSACRIDSRPTCRFTIEWAAGLR
jgi:divinyl protochlorophyllide a 8-vinyl-reductase